MAEEGFEDRRKAGEERTQLHNLADMDDQELEGPGSDERLERLRARFRSARSSERMSLSQLILIGIFVFLMVLLFGAGRYIIAAVAPKPPPGINAPL